MKISIMKPKWIEVPDELIHKLAGRHGYKYVEDFTNRSHYYQEEILRELKLYK